MEILIHRDGQDFGPYTVDEIKTYLHDGSILIDDFAWIEGTEGWKPLQDILAHLSSPPTPPQSTPQRLPPAPLERRPSLPAADLDSPSTGDLPALGAIKNGRSGVLAFGGTPVKRGGVAAAALGATSKKNSINPISLLILVVAIMGMVAFIAFGYIMVSKTLASLHWPGHRVATTH